VSARAALDAARAVFAPSLGQAPAEATTAPVWVELPDGASTPRARSVAMWEAAEGVLRSIVGREDLASLALVGEARRLQRLSLVEAHALVALHGWLDRQHDPGNVAAGNESLPNAEEQNVARDAWQVLERVVALPTAQSVTQASTPVAIPAGAPPASHVTATRPVPRSLPYDAPLGAHGTASPASKPPGDAPSSTARTAVPGTPLPGTPLPADEAWTDDALPPPRRWYRSSGALIGAIIVVLVGAAGAWYALAGRSGRDYRDGVAAYERGAREVARMSFARAAQSDEDDARPLIFLGRMAREENDLPRSRRFLEAAVRIDPNNSTALRELGSALLADGQPEIARRFYVRALELTPTDRLAQGFLGCTLFRLGRYDEAQRWVQRAGPGEWTPCVTGPPPMMLPAPPPMPPS
jgi:tetratricopeptide (TPR) repeat protein